MSKNKWIYPEDLKPGMMLADEAWENVAYVFVLRVKPYDDLGSYTDCWCMFTYKSGVIEFYNWTIPDNIPLREVAREEK